MSYPLFFCACDTGRAPRDPRRRHATRKSRIRGSGRPSQCVPHHIPPTPPAEVFFFAYRNAMLYVSPAPLAKSEALHAQISETLRGILSDDEFAAEAEAPG